jgi:VWFA-related protein
MRYVAAAAGIVMGTLVAPGQSQAPVFRSVTDAVAIDVAVSAGNRPVADLKAGDFAVMDNGVPQIVLDLTREAMPIAVSLIVDTSGSVRGPLFAALCRAVDDVSTRLAAGDTIRLVQFSEHLGLGDALSPQAGRTLSARLRPPAGYTSLLDALAVGLISEPRPGWREMAIVFTDGRDTTSIVSDDAVVELARRSNAAVFVVALAGASGGALPHEKLLRAVTGLSGGRLAAIARNQDLSRSFVQALDDFRTSYVVRYEPKGVERRGWHDLEVSIPGRTGYTIRARKGYFGG